MCEIFYNLRAEPFRLSPDHRFCYERKGYAKARAYMAYAFMREEGFVMVAGRPGTGKATLIGEFIESLAVSYAGLCGQLMAGVGSVGLLSGEMRQVLGAAKVRRSTV